MRYWRLPEIPAHRHESAPDLQPHEAESANGVARLMSAQHQRVAWDIIGLDTHERLLLLAYARHACQNCGLCWPGNVRLQIMTAMGRSTVTAVAARLVAGGHLRIHAYPRGGRGMSTEYVVLPKELGLSTAPCGKCVDNFKTNRTAGGFPVDNYGAPVDNS